MHENGLLKNPGWGGGGGGVGAVDIGKWLASGLYIYYVTMYTNTGSMLLLCICKSSYLFMIMFLENILIFNVTVHLKQDGKVANGRQLLDDQLKTRKTFYRPVWCAKGFRCSCKNLQPIKIHNNQWQPFAEFKISFYRTSNNQLPNRDFERL